MRFLVVDDSVTMRRIIINSLQRIGYTDCVEAGDGSEALERFDASIDCVITDWNMPIVGGLEFVQQLRQREDGRRVPVIMVTTRSARDDIVAAAQAGVNNYVVKPFTPQVLKEKIDQVLAGAAKAS
ncbi:MAG TPA: response regulator [Nannocystis sp.]|jgi:two-component system chemotaxis response regulator CheY